MMRQFIDLFNTFAGSAARLQSGLPAPAAAAAPPPMSPVAVPPPMSPVATPLPPPLMSLDVAAAHPALAAAEAALAAKLADGGAGCDADYACLLRLNNQLAQQRSFMVAEARPDLNRYCDVLPYDDNRILLGSSQPGSLMAAADVCSGGGHGGAASAAGRVVVAAAAGGSGDYINASPLRCRHEDDVQCDYIAAQGPLRHTREAFWQMVLEQEASAVVMLTNIVERGTPKCCRYFPEAPHTSKYCGRYLVSTRSCQQLLPNLLRRSLSVKDAGPQVAAPSQGTHRHRQPQPHPQPPPQMTCPPLQQKLAEEEQTTDGRRQTAEALGVAAPAPAASVSMQHFHYAAWPDHGVPASPEPLLALCAELHRRGAHARPIVVHCSAGIGRSGVFCVLDIVSRRLLRLLGSSDAAGGAAAVDVAALVAELRQQRLGMVQTREQYLFCHTALLHFIHQLVAQP